MGLVPKGSSGKFRLIVDLSSPHGGSVNDGIGPEWCSLEYVSVDSVAVVVARLGRGTILAKVDIRSAYRLVYLSTRTTDGCWVCHGKTSYL